MKREGAFLTILTFLIPAIGLLVGLILWLAGYFDR
jgi:hypothetical protein